MGRIKIPRCDNCGAPVEFAAGVFEARCEYCAEVLIRGPPAPVRQAPPPQPVPQRYVPPARASHAHKVWPIVIVSGATVAIAGASGIASFATNFKPLPAPAAEVRATVAAIPEVRTDSFAIRLPETRAEAEVTKSHDASTTRPRSSRPKTTAAPATAATPAEPPKPPKFDSQAAIAGLDAAKAKAEASCQSTTVKSLFVQMGFDADGKNRGAALSNPKHAGTPEAKCVLKIFRAVRIPAFDPATKPSGLGRMVRL
jgi:hypothetical protein